MTRLFLSVTILLSALSLYAQNVEGTSGSYIHGEFLIIPEPWISRIKKIELPVIDSVGIYSNDGTDNTLFYYVLTPKDSIKGMLILLPGTWEKAEGVLNNNAKLLQMASDNDLLVVVPSINSNICLNAEPLKFLNVTFTDVLKRFNPPKDKIVIAGFSLGGMNALRYTEMAYENSNITAIVPKAVYAVDPPLDLTTSYYRSLRSLERRFSEQSVNEAKDGLNKMNWQFRGTPESAPKKYVLYSMYSRKEKDGGNARFLKSVPVRIYCDPDVDWWMKNRRMDYYDMNAPDQTAMINQLNIMGNDKAEFINALGKGYRSDGSRHPLSWSIVDARDCINWILKCIE